MGSHVQGPSPDGAEANRLGRLRADIGKHLGYGARKEYKSGAKLGAPTVYVRHDRPVEGEPQVGIRYAGEAKLVGVPESRIDDVRKIVAALMVGHEATLRGVARAAETTVAQALDWDLARSVPKCRATKAEKARHARLVTRTANVKRLIGGLFLREVDDLVITRYVDARMGERWANRKDQDTAPFVSEATACSELGDLRRAIQRFERKFGLDYAPEITAPKPFRRREYLLTRNAAARVLMACRGYVWDPHGDGWHVVLEGGHRDPEAKFKRVWIVGKGGWMTNPVVDPVTKEPVIDPLTGEPKRCFVRRNRKAVMHRRAVARVLLGGVYTGTRHTALVNLAWVMHADRGCIDVVNGVIHRAGFGEDPGGGKPRMSSVLRPKAAFWADIWLAADTRHEIRHVIHKPDGTGYHGRVEAVWWETVADAGIPNLLVHHLRHAAITWMMLDGKTSHETADTLGLDVRTVERVYRKTTLATQRVRRRWGRDNVAKGWDAVNVLDPVAPTNVAADPAPLARKAGPSRPGIRLPVDGRSVRRQPIRFAKPRLPRRSKHS